MNQKQSEVNLMRKIFEEILKSVGKESTILDAFDADLEPLGTF